MSDERQVLTIRAMAKDLEAGRAEFPETNHYRPRTRGECVDGPRPCPYVSCQHHLYLDVTEAGSIKLNFPHLEVWELEETCALDVADRGGATLEDVGVIMNLTRERTRQIEVGAASQLERHLTRVRLPMLPAEPLT